MQRERPPLIALDAEGLAALVAEKVVAMLPPLVRDEVRAVLEEQRQAVYVSTRAAAALVGTTPAGLRARARRSNAVAACRVDGRRWDRARLLLAAVEAA